MEKLIGIMVQANGVRGITVQEYDLPIESKTKKTIKVVPPAGWYKSLYQLNDIGTVTKGNWKGIRPSGYEELLVVVPEEEVEEAKKHLINLVKASMLQDIERAKYALDKLNKL